MVQLEAAQVHDPCPDVGHKAVGLGSVRGLPRRKARMRALVSTAEWQRSASAYTYGVVGLALKRKEDVGHVTKVRQLLWTRRQLSSIVRRHLCNASPARARACHPRQGRPATIPCASKRSRPASTVSMYSCTSSLAVFVSYWCLIVWNARPSRRTPLASTESAPCNGWGPDAPPRGLGGGTPPARVPAAVLPPCSSRLRQTWSCT